MAKKTTWGLGGMILGSALTAAGIWGYNKFVKAKSSDEYKGDTSKDMYEEDEED